MNCVHRESALIASNQDMTHAIVHYATMRQHRKSRQMSLMLCAMGPAHPVKKKAENERADVLERTAMRVKDITRALPKPIVVEILINGKPATALIDTGSLSDFMSTTLAVQVLK